MDNLELISFKIISAVGSARSNYIKSIQESKQGNFKTAQTLIEEGENYFLEGHKAHMDLLTMQANGEKIDIDVLLIHAEDQMMSAEGFKIVSEEFLEMYQMMYRLLDK